MDLRERPFQKKIPNEKGEKIPACSQRDECDFLEAAHTLLASEVVTWQGGTPPKATSKVAWLVPGILIFGNPTFCVPEPDRQTVGGRGRRMREPRRRQPAGQTHPRRRSPGDRQRSGDTGSSAQTRDADAVPSDTLPTAKTFKVSSLTFRFLRPQLSNQKQSQQN